VLNREFNRLLVNGLGIRVHSHRCCLIPLSVKSRIQHRQPNTAVGLKLSVYQALFNQGIGQQRKLILIPIRSQFEPFSSPNDKLRGTLLVQSAVVTSVLMVDRQQNSRFSAKAASQ
jgi:hypothetical protein